MTTHDSADPPIAASTNGDALERLAGLVSGHPNSLPLVRYGGRVTEVAASHVLVRGIERRVELGTAVEVEGGGARWLGEVIVHNEDIRRPLGMPHAYPTEWVTRVIEFYRGSNVLIGGKRRTAGLTLRATDTDWSHGSGPAVEGPAMSLLMATSGRSVALDDLTGEGI